MPTDNSKYGISREDIERAAFGDFDDYEPSDSVQQNQNINIQNVEPVQDNGPVDIYSNGVTDYNNVVFCTSCGTQLPADSLFCTSCGASVNVDSVVVFCTNCGNQAPADSQFCTSCGALIYSGYNDNQQYDQQYDNGQYFVPDSDTIFCVACGNQIPAGSQFCTSCGTPISSGYDDSQQYQQYDNNDQVYAQQYGDNQMYNDDSPTLAADGVLNGQYSQYAADNAYEYNAQPGQYASAEPLVFCSACGAQISASCDFCTSCGTPVAPDMGYAEQFAQPAPKRGFFSKFKNK